MKQGRIDATAVWGDESTSTEPFERMMLVYKFDYILKGIKDLSVILSANQSQESHLPDALKLE